jgi:hypothetical protein
LDSSSFLGAKGAGQPKRPNLPTPLSSLGVFVAHSYLFLAHLANNANENYGIVFEEGKCFQK